MKKEPTAREILMKKIQDEPYNYPLCVKQDCPMKEQCLHHTCIKANHAKTPFLNIYNNLDEDISKGCSRFANSTKPVVYALGFERFVRRLNLDEKMRFQTRCMREYCKSLYYEMRGGKRIIYPWEQKKLRELALKEKLNFPENGFDFLFQANDWHSAG